MGQKITSERLDHLFRYHPPKPGDPPRFEAVRNAAREFAQVVIDSTPTSADQNAALRKIREAVMTANAAIALE